MKTCTRVIVHMGFFALTSIQLMAQAIVSGVAPASIVKNYSFVPQAGAGGWPGETNTGVWGFNGSTLNFNTMGNHVLATAVLVNDGSTGTNTPFGNLLSEEGCNSSPTNAYAGKIVLIRRNTCSFAAKILKAQQAGAVAVVIINRDDASLSMGTGPESPSVTIPAVMISKTDGEEILAALKTGAVVLFMGNKFGINTNDIGSTRNSIVLPPQVLTPKSLAKNTGDFSFTPGISLVNYGTALQNNVKVYAKISAPGQPTAYLDSVTPLTIAFKDTLKIYSGGPKSFSPFSMANYPVGEYQLTYTISMNNHIDQSLYDNVFTTKFYVTDSLFSYSSKAIENAPVALSYPKNHLMNYKSCIRFQHASASNSKVEGMYFAIKGEASVTLSQQTISLYAYEWADANTTLKNPAATFNALNVLSTKNFTPSSTYVNGNMTYVPFNQPLALVNNKKYLFCTSTAIPEISFGYDGQTNYGFNRGIDNNSFFPTNSDGSWDAVGWKNNPTPSIGLLIKSNSTNSLEENTTTFRLNVYPNPTNDNITLSTDGIDFLSLTMTDFMGRTVPIKELKSVGKDLIIAMETVESGIYTLNVLLKNGQVLQTKIVKK